MLQNLKGNANAEMSRPRQNSEPEAKVHLSNRVFFVTYTAQKTANWAKVPSSFPLFSY
jgi:hypothetical protein